MNPKCSNCDAEILMGEPFSAKRDESGKWTVLCQKHPDSPTSIMSPARAWVVNGDAQAHRAEQKAIEDAESVS